MKKYLIFSFLVLFFMSAFSVDMSAQYRSKKSKKKKTTTNRKSDYFDERGGDIKDRLWYGADATIQFGAINGRSTFTYGLGPMVGYKITDDFSIGPRISFENQISKFSTDGIERTFNAVNLGGGVFARHKFLQNYFVHAEYQILSETFGVFDNSINDFVYDANNKVVTVKEAASHYYLGLGYGGNAGGIGFTTYALWDFSEDFNSQNIPLVIRFGLTYNF